MQAGWATQESTAAIRERTATMKICELEAHSFFENQHFSTKIREIEAQSFFEN